MLNSFDTEKHTDMYFTILEILSDDKYEFNLKNYNIKWLELISHDWYSLLDNYNYLIKYYDKVRSKTHLELLSQEQWYRLIGRNPDLSNYIDISSFSSRQLMRIVENHPQLIFKFSPFKINSEDWISLIKRRPILLRSCPIELFSAYQWISLIEEDTSVGYYRFCDWGKFELEHWKYLLERNRISDKIKVIANKYIPLLTLQ